MNIFSSLKFNLKKKKKKKNLIEFVYCLATSYYGKKIKVKHCASVLVYYIIIIITVIIFLLAFSQMHNSYNFKYQTVNIKPISIEPEQIDLPAFLNIAVLGN